MQETINLTPNPDNLVRYFREIFKTDPIKAVELLQAGWPQLSQGDALAVLGGDLTLAAALEAK
jgi:hypothetical protein